MSRAVSLGKHLKEIRIHLCQTSEASKGVRDFVKNHYVPLKSSNPNFPILVRECQGISPVIYARYGFGYERNRSLERMNADQVFQVISNFANTAPPKTL